jgi:cell division protein FtsW
MIGQFLDKAKGDKQIWMILGILASISILSVYSSARSLAYRFQGGNTEYYLVKHLFILIFGLGITFLIHRLNHIYYSRIAQLMMVLSIPLLLYTLFFGQEINDAKRWITLPVINLSFQSSDFAKLALIMYTSRTLSKKQGVIKNFKEGFLPIIIPIGIICGLIMLENMSSAVLLFATNFVIMFIGRVSTKYLLLTVLSGTLLITGIVAASYMMPERGRFHTWQGRIDGFIHGEGNGEPIYQVKQANIAIANGGLIRFAPGKSTQCNFLPEAYCDYIYATIIEEYGLMGGLVIMLIYLWFLYRITIIVKTSKKAFGALMALGLGTSLVIQAFVNMAVAVGLLPVTGLTLPFLSMGGTSIWFNGIAVGIILSVSRGIEENTQEKKEAKSVPSSKNNNPTYELNV